MSETDIWGAIRRALNARLSAFTELPVDGSGDALVHWENAEFQPPSPTGDDLWIRVHLLPAGAGPRGAGALGATRLGGIYRLTVFAPKSRGPGAATELVGKLAHWFKAGTSLTEGTSSVLCLVPSPPRQGPDRLWYQLILDVNWASWTDQL